ncbi:MAG TPA: hypothetical protein VMK32_06220 [Burkholderiaceae bacterium]|nr:hypothetical protein [Burkholderiaceae bacterium]
MIQPSRSAGFAKIAVAVAFAGSLAGGAPASAQEVRGPADLEATFWRCDYDTTQGLLDIGSAEVCSKATEALRIERFHGNFESMLAWWQQNKKAAHRVLQARAAGAEPAVAMEDLVGQMSEADLKRLYLRCAHASEQRRLDPDEIKACSVGWNALLARVFDGSFEAMLAWYEQELRSGIEVAQRTDTADSRASR